MVTDEQMSFELFLKWEANGAYIQRRRIMWLEVDTCCKAHLSKSCTGWSQDSTEETLSEHDRQRIIELKILRITVLNYLRVSAMT